MNHKKILFLLPAQSPTPAGGPKIVFEYANRLAVEGHEVSVAYPAFGLNFQYEGQPFKNFLRKGKAWLRYVSLRLSKGYSCRSWFPLHPCVKERWLFSFSPHCLPKVDCYVATYITTAYELSRFLARAPWAEGYYFIQHFEAWGNVTRERVLASYKLPLHKIVIASWLKRIVEGEKESCVLVPNAFDFSYFRLATPIERREAFTIVMLAHTHPWKGTDDAVAALAIVRKQFPSLRVESFGAMKRPYTLPPWCSYHRNPDKYTLNKLYNDAAIFVGASRTEGWGLTVGEAMICGCAVACTDNEGYAEMAEHNITALVSPVCNPEALAQNIVRLIADSALRYRIAHTGNTAIHRFTWDTSYALMRTALRLDVDSAPRQSEAVQSMRPR